MAASAEQKAVSKGLRQLHSKGVQCIVLPPHPDVYKSAVVHLSKHNFVNLCFNCLCFLPVWIFFYCLHSRSSRKPPKLSTFTQILHSPLPRFLLRRQQHCTMAHLRADLLADKLCVTCILTSRFARKLVTLFKFPVLLKLYFCFNKLSLGTKRT